MDSGTRYVWAQGAIAVGATYPVSRVGFCMIYSDFLQGVIVFGGMAVTRLNDVFLYKVAENRWIEIQASGKLPAERAFASCFIEGERFYVFGGLGEKDRSLSDLHVLFLDTMQWSQVFTVPSPEPRHMTAVASTFSLKNAIFFDELPSEDTKNTNVGYQRPSLKRPLTVKSFGKTELNLVQRKSIFGGNFGQLLKNAPGPAATDDVTKVYVFGGINVPSDTTLNDLWVFSYPPIHPNDCTGNGYSSYQWTKLTTSGEVTLSDAGNALRTQHAPHKRPLVRDRRFQSVQRTRLETATKAKIRFRKHV